MVEGLFGIAGPFELAGGAMNAQGRFRSTERTETWIIGRSWDVGTAIARWDIHT